MVTDTQLSSFTFPTYCSLLDSRVNNLSMVAVMPRIRSWSVEDEGSEPQFDHDVCQEEPELRARPELG